MRNAEPMMTSAVQRRLPCGVDVHWATEAHARVWAPACRRVDVVAADTLERWPLAREARGYHSGIVPLSAGDRYWLALDGERLRPDPCSRWQPEGPHGPSVLVDPATFAWTDEDWRGVSRDGSTRKTSRGRD